MADESRANVEYLELLREVSLGTIVELLRSIERARETPEAAAQRAARSATVPPSGSGGLNFLMAIAQVQLSTWGQLLELHRSQFDFVAAKLRGLGLQGRAASGRETTTVALAGPPGTVVTATLDIANDSGAPAEVSFSVGEFVGADDAARFTTRVDITPVDGRSAEQTASDRRIGAGSHRTFQLSLRLDDPFRARKRYAAQILVLSQSAVWGDATIEIAVTDPPAPGAIALAAER